MSVGPIRKEVKDIPVLHFIRQTNERSLHLDRPFVPCEQCGTLIGGLDWNKDSPNDRYTTNPKIYAFPRRLGFRKCIEVTKAIEVIDTTITPDPEYDFIKPLRPDEGRAIPMRRGTQCGECGMKFDYNISYGYGCSNNSCPMGYR